MAVTVAIVGAGATGLACAAALGRSAVVVDRIPVCGGILGFDHADTRRLEAAARARRVRRCTSARRPSPGTAPSWSRWARTASGASVRAAW